ncbi:glycosyltransferase [Daeguia caeni]|uniref:Glycosyltransferase n=1 Tax=Daeguia caeni TaxID=439612 RepID=A0ABV9H5K0_9HYPH
MVGNPLFTIIMPTHSRVDVIGHAIESLRNQTVQDFELLVVGDGCAPGTGERVASFNDPRIRFFDLPKAPFFGYANRNVALRESRGTYIGFMADDDLVTPDHLEILRNALDGGAALAYTQALWVSTDGIAAPFLTNLDMADQLELFMFRANSIPASCFAYRADVLPTRDAWPEDVPVAADWRLWQKIINAAPEHPLTYCRTPTVLHFSAKRKNARHSNMGALANYLAIADTVDWWPSALRQSIAPDQTEQGVYAALLSDKAQDFTGRLRQAAQDLVDRLTWQYIQSAPDSQMAELQSALQQQEALRAAERAHIAALEQKISALQQDIALLTNQLAARTHEVNMLNNARSIRLARAVRKLLHLHP